MRDHNLPNAAFTGFVTGVLIGSGLGLLLAPASGRTTRARVSYRLRETAGSARGLKERLRDRLRPATATAVEPRAS